MHDLLWEIYYTIKLKDPCKTCLVKACCSEKCEDAKFITRFIFPHSTLKDKKQMTFVSVGGILLSVISFVVLILKEL